jgi:hypothetical protein
VSTDRNVIIRKLSYELMDLGFDLVKGENLRADEIRLFWRHMMDGCATLIGEHPSPPNPPTLPPQENDGYQRRFHDD